MFLCRVEKSETPKGAANFVSAFGKAFDLLDKSIAASAGFKKRPTTILFLSDTDAASPVEAITKRRNTTFGSTPEKLLIFTYSLGDSVTDKTKATLGSWPTY